VTIPTGPGTAFKMVKAKFFFELAVVVFNKPPQLGVPNEGLNISVLGKI
jgi:hypothetical protein